MFATDIDFAPNSRCDQERTDLPRSALMTTSGQDAGDAPILIRVNEEALG
jgi:hypothetical protein